MSTHAPSPPRAEIAAYILGGGASRRMGSSKIGLSHDGRRVVEALAERLAPHVSEVVVVLKESQRHEVSGLRCIFDGGPERGVVHGIRAVLQAPGPAWRLVLACDMPDVQPSVLTLLWDAAQAAAARGACVQRADRAHPEPFPSLWHADVAGHIQPEWGMTARDWLGHARLAVSRLPAMSDASLVNLNTADEWRDWVRGPNNGVGR